MILIHRWTCKECDYKCYLKVNDENDLDRIRLGRLELMISAHVMKTKHEIIHRETEEFKIYFK